jgi:hypothetical protein
MIFRYFSPVKSVKNVSNWGVPPPPAIHLIFKQMLRVFRECADMGLDF